MRVGAQLVSEVIAAHGPFELHVQINLNIDTPLHCAIRLIASCASHASTQFEISRFHTHAQQWLCQ